MNSLRSSVLVIGHPSPNEVLFGADFTDDFKGILDPIELQSFAVVAFPATSSKKSQLFYFLEQMELHRPDAQKILVLKEKNPELLEEIINKGNIFRVLENYNQPEFEQAVQMALEEASLYRQKIDLENMAHDQNQRLKVLTSQLEEMVKKRGSNLIRSRKRLLTTNNKTQAMHKALMAIHQANSVGEMGGLVNEALSDYLKLSWTRIFFSSTSSLHTSLAQGEKFEIYTIPLLQGNVQIGEISFARAKKIQFTKEQIEFLNQVAEGVSLALDRLTKHEEAEGLKQQWEATFDAISEPLCLTDGDFNILRTNKSFAETCDMTYEKLFGQNCFKAFLGTENPEGFPGKRDSFHFHCTSARNQDETTYKVSCQTPPSGENESVVRLLLFRDISDQLRMERQILESAKLAEIGTIGSSIAHELNNPLGGMISFLQLLKMDCPKEDPMWPDINEMDQAAHKGKEIIENLLGFSRRYDSSETKNLDLREVILQSIKITELQTRSRGIQTALDLPEKLVLFSGNFNLLSQAICNLLQNALDSVSDIMKENPRYQGKIRVSLVEENSQITISIFDNGVGIGKDIINKIFNPLFSTKDPKTNSGLGLTVAYKIIDEHHGRLEISSQSKEETVAKIAFPSPESST